MKRGWFAISIGLAIAITMLFFILSPKPKQTITIQPLGYIDSEILAAAEAQITASYSNVVIVRHPPVDLPTSAYYSPRNRYRAEKLLDYLNTLRKDERSKIVGITTSDISTTKGDLYDWGVLGLGELGGGACVVSTFRLKRSISNDLFLQRFKKVVVHELGHTFGLDHCNAKQCVMEDYKGTVTTLDASKGDFCTSCKSRILHL